jgi:DNA polymerase elongation subunit (family B)
MASEVSGWLLDVYPDQQDGAVVWLLDDDGARRRFARSFPTLLYLAGPPDRLGDAGRAVERSGIPARLERLERRDLYQGMLPVLAVEAAGPLEAAGLVRRLRRRFRRLHYYDVDIPFSVRFLAATGVFPTARVQAEVSGDRLLSIRALDDPWAFQFDFPPVRTLHIEPDRDPRHAAPGSLCLAWGGEQRRLSLDDPRRVLETLNRLLADYDPDLLLAPGGDAWLFPQLFAWAEGTGIPFQPNRDRGRAAALKKAFTFHSYGDVHHRAAQTHLFGRWHIDPYNTSMFGGFSLAAALEMARVTGLPLQVAARNSPGAGFTAMQMAEALRRGVLVPLHKRQVEPLRPVSAFTLADSGGLNYRPLVGLHYSVAELDFFSMYPQIMAVWNISGETVGREGKVNRHIPQSGVPIAQDEPGLVATVLKPVLVKRRRAKLMLKEIPRDDPRWPVLEAAAEGLKWLGWVSFGYQGFKNNRFGSPQAHEAICAIGREALTIAKETAFRLGFTVLGANTDSLFVQKQGAAAAEDFTGLLEEIQRQTGLILNLEAVFEWLAFPPAKGNRRIGASNRYFGKYLDGGLKIRGIAQRREDTPPWIAGIEARILDLLAAVPRERPLETALPEIVALARGELAALWAGRVPLRDLVVSQKLSRQPEEYHGQSSAAEAARQLRRAGHAVEVGQRLRFLYVRGEPGARAWDVPSPDDQPKVDARRYQRLLALAVHGVLAPLGFKEQDVESMLAGGVRQLAFEFPAGERPLATPFAPPASGRATATSNSRRVSTPTGPKSSTATKQPAGGLESMLVADDARGASAAGSGNL